MGFLWFGDSNKNNGCDAHHFEDNWESLDETRARIESYIPVRCSWTPYVALIDEQKECAVVVQRLHKRRCVHKNCEAEEEEWKSEMIVDHINHEFYETRGEFEQVVHDSVESEDVF